MAEGQLRAQFRSTEAARDRGDFQAARLYLEAAPDSDVLKLRGILVQLPGSLDDSLASRATALWSASLESEAAQRATDQALEDKFSRRSFEQLVEELGLLLLGRREDRPDRVSRQQKIEEKQARLKEEKWKAKGETKQETDERKAAEKMEQEKEVARSKEQGASTTQNKGGGARRALCAKTSLRPAAAGRSLPFLPSYPRICPLIQLEGRHHPPAKQKLPPAGVVRKSTPTVARSRRFSTTFEEPSFSPPLALPPRYLLSASLTVQRAGEVQPFHPLQGFHRQSICTREELQ